MDHEALLRLKDKKVAVRLKNVEAGGVEITATLDDVREDGIVLREVGELGSGPTMFCPWESLQRVRERPPGPVPPHERPPGEEEIPEGPWPGEAYHLRGTPAEGEARESWRDRRQPSARTLERVVPLGQKRSVGAVAVALTSLELHGEGVGVLRWRVSLGGRAFRDRANFWHGIAEPIFEIRDDAGRELPWSPRGSGAGDSESDGHTEFWGLPESGEVEVTVVRLGADAYGPEGDYLGEGDSIHGPWNFRFSL